MLHWERHENNSGERAVCQTKTRAEEAKARGSGPPCRGELLFAKKEKDEASDGEKREVFLPKKRGADNSVAGSHGKLSSSSGALRGDALLPQQRQCHIGH